ncbi:MAG: Maf family protein [Capsulimonadaceae bacterium]|nr:Maf family protein [Capsulimonadaceae bacterium]
MTKRRLVLASASPRRRELLSSLGLAFDVIPSTVDESLAVASLGEAPTPDRIVRALAEAKALDVAARTKGDALVLGADTIVVVDGVVLGKPESPDDAAAMLLTLAGRTHQVYTGLSLIEVSEGAPGIPDSRSDATDVEFEAFDMERARAYVATGEPLDKAGGYGIQALGALLIPRISGDYFTVVGLPLYTLGQMLEAAGVRML